VKLAIASIWKDRFIFLAIFLALGMIISTFSFLNVGKLDFYIGLHSFLKSFYLIVIGLTMRLVVLLLQLR
jgi:E3 ubiquitin-protein ligase DOA10